MYQMPLPTDVTRMSEAEAVARIWEIKRLLGERLVVLGHHYQRDDVIQFADFRGDSLRLSQLAAEQKDADYIVFCGVHFMAESADILTSEKQIVLLPDMTAGCSMSDMAEIDQVEEAWEALAGHFEDMSQVVPVTYVNSSAAIKAFTGRNGGVCCTSSNCRAIFEAVWAQKPDARIFFLPDEHLGRNTAYAMGVPLDKMPVYDPFDFDGGLTAEQFADSRLILWKGFCSVHGEFTVEQIQKIRAEDPAVRVIVHPECTFDVVQAADDSGSTSKIVKVIGEAAPGNSWAVGTEINLVKRLAAEVADKGIRVRSLSGKACPCSTMYRIDLPHLVWIMEKVLRHSQDPTVKLVNRITVAPETRAGALLALDRMMDISAKSIKV